VVILFAGLLAVWLIRQRRERRPPVKPDLPVPVSAPLVYGPSPDVEIFTDSCAQEAWQLWQSGQQRRALSLLYRASLARLMTHYRVDFGPGATEDECLQRAGNQLKQAEIIDFLQRLTRLWQTVAYAHRCADTAEVQRLCEQWRDFFVNQDARDG
jgi:hypothetical protein